MNLTAAAKIRLLYFFSFCCQAAWAPRFADFLQGKGYSGFELGLLLSITPVMMFLVQPVYGFIADKFGHRRTLLLGALLAALFFLGHLISGGFYYVAFVTVLMSLFFNATQPIIDSLALQTASNDAAVTYGNLRVAGALAWSFMGVVNGHLIDGFALEVIFITASVAMGITFLIALTLPEARKKQPAIASEEPSKVWQVLRNPTLLTFLGLTILVSVASTTMWNFYSLFMKEIGATDKLTGYGFSFQGLCELPLFYYSAQIIAKLGLKRALLLTLLVTAIRMCLYGWVKNPELALFIELTHGISWSLFWVVSVELTDRLVKTEWQATGQSLLYASYFGIGAILGNFWTSYLYEHMKLGHIFLLNAGIIGVAGVVAWIMIHEPQKQKQES